MPLSSYDLNNFRNRVFVETGSAGLGLGIQSALKAGFEEVHSVEINPTQYQECYEIVKNDKRVHLSLGDCGEWLDKTLNMIDEPCTIYLDANGYQYDQNLPFNSAIDAIVRHGKQYHTILVDDMNHARQSLQEVERALLDINNEHHGHIGRQLRRINPNYQLSIIDSHSEDMQLTYNAWIAVAKP